MLECSAKYNGGGLVHVTAQSMQIEGNITARGYLGSSGGGINLKLTGGALEGSGVLDVGVSWDGASASDASYKAGGGRISISGYGSISEAVVANARMNGALSGSAPGTFLHTPQGSAVGHLVVRAVGYSPTTETPIDLHQISNLLSLTVENTEVNFVQALPLSEPTIRLTSTTIVGQGESTRGLLEVSILNRWGTVCNDLFGAQEGIVACRQLGLGSYVGFTSGSSSTLPVLMDDTRCTGSESLMQLCPYSSSPNCGHGEDVQLQCKGECLLLD